MWDVPLFPEQASTTAAKVDALYFGLLGLTFFFVALIYGLLLYFGIKYRRGSRADRSNPVSTSHKIEALWIGIPFVISIVFFVWASRVYFELYNPPKDAAEVFVVGKQWMWYLQHPEGKRETNELHVPLGRPVKLTMTSQDVIHSFFVPAFRMKQDVLPGRYTSTWFQPTKTGRYHLYCAEYCGTNHSVMGGFVYVMEPADYERWLSQGSVGESMVTAGAKLFQQYHCNGCHGANPTVRAPRLEGVFGGPVPVQEGKSTRMVVADDRYLRDSILMPQSQIVAGYDPVMPSYEGQISEPDLLQILAYIKSLGRNGGDTP
jgi:cytochrome c oxidase subunit II